MDELRGETQAAMSSIVANFNKELQALQAFEAAKDRELQTYKAKIEARKVEVEVYKARVGVEALKTQIKVCMATMDNDRVVQLSTTPKGNAPRPPAFYRARSVREMVNFLFS